MEARRYTSISRNKHLITTPTNTRRPGSRSLNPDTARVYRSKTPQPGGRSRGRPKPRKPPKRPTKSPRRLLQYRARKDSEPQKEIEEELPDYIKATTPQPHIFNTAHSSYSSNNLYLNDSPQDMPEIPTFAPNITPNDNSMFTFVKSQFEPDMGFQRNRINSNSNSSSSIHSNYNNPHQLPTIPTINASANPATPIPIIHNQLSPHKEQEFNTKKIHQIPKPPPPRISPRSVQPPPPPRKGSNSATSTVGRSRACSSSSTASTVSEFGTLLSPKQMEETILSHYEQQPSPKDIMISSSSSSSYQPHLRQKTPFKPENDKLAPKVSGSPRDKLHWKSKIGFLNNNKNKKSKGKKTKKDITKKRNSRSKSNSKPFNDEDHIENKNNDKHQMFPNKYSVHKPAAFTPLAPPKSTPSPSNSSINNNWQQIPTINPVHSLQPLQPLHPLQPPRSYVLPINNGDNDKEIDRISPYPLNNIDSSLHSHLQIQSNNRPKSKTVGDYEDQGYNEENSDEFMDDREVANKSFAYNRSLKKQETDGMDLGNTEQYERLMDKMRFKCDQLDWNLSELQTKTDKDVRQITAKMHRVEHDMKTQNELQNRSQSHHKNGHQRRNSIFNSLESSISAVMRNVDSIKDALQTLDLRMSIINQRQHDIFKHIDETQDILENVKSSSNDHHESNESKSNGATPLVLNALDKDALLSSRRASLQSMSEMLRLQSTRAMSITETDRDHNSNQLLLPTYDDNEDILNSRSPTKIKLMGHIRPELLLQAQTSINGPSGRETILPPSANRGGMEAYILPKGSISQDVKITTRSGSGDYGIAIERTVTTPIYGIGLQLQGNIENIQNILPLKTSGNVSSGGGDRRSSKNQMALQSIVENDNDDDSTESELSMERNTAPISVPPLDDEKENDGDDDDDDEEQQPVLKKKTSLSRRRHKRSSLDSGLSNKIIDKIRSETMIIHSDSNDLQHEDDEKAMEYHETPGGDDDVDEEKQYMLKNKENERKNIRKRHSAHSRSINVSMDDVDMKTLKVAVPSNKMSAEEMNRKYSESYSINIHQCHNKNTSTHTGQTLAAKLLTLNRSKQTKSKNNKNNKNNRNKNPVSLIFDNIDNQQRDRKREGSMSFDAMEPNMIKYEREVSRSDGVSTLINDLDPLSLKNNINNTNNNQSLLPPVTDTDNDSTHNHSDDDDDDDDDDSMSDLSADNGTFIIHGDTLKNELNKEKLKEEESKFIEKEENNFRKKRKSKKKQMITMMNCQFILNIVPNTFSMITDFIMSEWNDKPSYLLTIFNSTTSHDLFFKTSHIYTSKSKKVLRYFRETNNNNTNDDDDDDIIVIDDSMQSDDHLAPMEDMTFGDINIKRGYRYCGYFVFEAYPFPNTNNSDDNGMRSRQSSTVITPHCKNNPVTPQLKPHTILNAIDEKHKALNFNQFNELKLGSMSPSTVNKYRRQSLSTSSRRTSLQFVSPLKNRTLRSEEPSVTSLLDRALDEEHNDHSNYPWNDDLDDLIDIIIGYDIEISVGDPELNSFKCYIQFNEYAQPTYYQSQLKNIKLLKEFCNGGGDGLQLRGGLNNQLLTKININDHNSIHPQIIFDCGYSKHYKQKSSNQETFDID